MSRSEPRRSQGVYPTVPTKKRVALADGSVGSWAIGNNHSPGAYDHNLELSYGNPGPPYHSGRGFLLTKYDLVRELIPIRSSWTGSYEYSGVQAISTAPNASTIPSQWTTLWSDGATAVARFSPAQPEVSVAQFIGELKDLPQTVMHRWGVNRGSDYLNVTFGILPMVRDLQRMHQLQRSLGRRLRQLRRDNGRVIRRRGTLREVLDTNTVESTGVFVTPYTAPSGNLDRATTTTTSYTKSWFSGAFRYFVPDLGQDYWTPTLIRHLYGTAVTPELLWNLTPWTWLADWFANAGDVLHNLASNPLNLTMKYGYVMRELQNEQIVKVSYDYGGPYIKGTSPVTLRGFAQSRATRSVKTRAAAFPYGFGPTPGVLNNYQYAILAALGFNRFGRLT